MKIYLIAAVFLVICMLPIGVGAQSRVPTATPTEIVTDSVTVDVASDEAKTASGSALEAQKINDIAKDDVTKPEEPDVKGQFLELFAKRPAKNPSLMNFMAYTVQYAVAAGVPANTIILILLLPFLSTGVVFTRHIIGFPSLGLLVPIALSITLVATGITAGLILLVSILVASTFARILLKQVRIIQLPKVSLSMLVVSIFIFATLIFSAKAGILAVRQLSIFPVLLLILLSERIVQLQLERSFRETMFITLVTLMLGLIGYVFLSSETIRNLILLYPEIILILIPANIVMGRYFGLRLTEYYRFAPVRHASK